VIRWDKVKDDWLKKTRGVSFQEISDMILSGLFLDILENPKRPNQDIFVLWLHEYVWVVPFVVESSGSIFLKTAYPSRKMQKRYGEKNA
jgi:hypothetical protein